MQTLDTIKAILNQCHFKDWDIVVRLDDSRPYLQVQFDDACAVTGAFERQYCRKWMLSYHMTDSEIVTTAYKAVMAAIEHEVREHFTFQNQRIFNPHFDVYALVQLSKDKAISKRA